MEKITLNQCPWCSFTPASTQVIGYGTRSQDLFIPCGCRSRASKDPWHPSPDLRVKGSPRSSLELYNCRSYEAIPLVKGGQGSDSAGLYSSGELILAVVVMGIVALAVGVFLGMLR